MKAFCKKTLSGTTFLIALLGSSTVFASCPLVGGYSVTAHAANDARCTYTSNKIVKLPLPGKPNQNLCPRFILTDPNYTVTTACHLDIRITKCVCKTTRR